MIVAKSMHRANIITNIMHALFQVWLMPLEDVVSGRPRARHCVPTIWISAQLVSRVLESLAKEDCPASIQCSVLTAYLLYVALCKCRSLERFFTSRRFIIVTFLYMSHRNICAGLGALCHVIRLVQSSHRETTGHICNGGEMIALTQMTVLTFAVVGVVKHDLPSLC